jgi:hypothetical protein
MKALALLGRNQPLISRTSPSLNVNGAAVAGSETELALLTHGFFDRYDIVVPTLQKSLLESYHNELLPPRCLVWANCHAGSQFGNP